MTAEHNFDMAPRDEAGYLLLNADWRILAADDGSTFAGDGAVSLVGQHAAAVIGPAALTSLQAHGATVFTLDNVDYVLSATTFELPTGTIRVVRAQEMQATLEHVVSLLVHEVRNPLSAMRTLVQGLEEELSGTPPSATAYTSRLAGEIDRLGRLLVSMAQVARLRARPPELLSPAQVLERVAAIFQPELARHGIQVQVIVTARVGPIYADPDQVQQLLVNLVTNAADAMPAGGHITLRARLDARGRTMLLVEDTGVGMSTEELERAMRPRHSSKAGGMGLGLMIARGIVRQHHGRMRVASVAGKGTTVSITFPLPPLTSPAPLASL
jgi:signal transduction histidine kinase